MITSGDDPRLSIDDPDKIHDHHVGEVLAPTIHVADLDAITAAALGYRVAPSTVWKILHQAGIDKITTPRMPVWGAITRPSP